MEASLYSPCANYSTQPPLSKQLYDYSACPILRMDCKTWHFDLSRWIGNCRMRTVGCKLAACQLFYDNCLCAHPYTTILCGKGGEFASLNDCPCMYHEMEIPGVCFLPDCKSSISAMCQSWKHTWCTFKWQLHNISLTRNKSCFVSTVSNPSSFTAAEQAVYSCIAHKSGERLRKDFWGKYDSFRGQKILLHKFLLFLPLFLRKEVLVPSVVACWHQKERVQY